MTWIEKTYHRRRRQRASADSPRSSLRPSTPPHTRRDNTTPEPSTKAWAVPSAYEDDVGALRPTPFSPHALGLTPALEKTDNQALRLCGYVWNHRHDLRFNSHHWGPDRGPVGSYQACGLQHAFHPLIVITHD